MEAANFVEASAAAVSIPGTMLRDIFGAMKKAYEEIGYPEEWKNHTQGGISNYRPCELGINDISEIRLRVDDTISFNPTISGVKSEESYLVGKDSTEQLCSDERWPGSRIDIDGNSYYMTDILEI